MRSVRTIVVSTIIGLVLIGCSVALAAHAAEEHISAFDVLLDVQSDSTIQVTEAIVYDFGATEHHGIYRDIPYTYKRSGSSYKLRLTVDSVTDDTGTTQPYTTSRGGGELSLKIGDPNRTISGLHTYVITYTVQRAINYFDDHDELYWNVTGDQWQVGIDEASASVTLPESLTADQRLAECFTGAAGSTSNDCTIDFPSNYEIDYFTDSSLASYEGLTIVAGWPKGITVAPSTSDRIWWFVQDNWYGLIPFIVVIGMLYLWYTRGRDPRGRGTIIPQYDPPDSLSAGLVGTVVDERADLRDISATIIQLAVKGYLTIKQTNVKKIIGSKTDYEFIKKKEADSALEAHEKEIFDALFSSGSEISVSSLKNKFYTSLPGIKKAMYRQVVESGYFPTSPDSVRRMYSILGAVIMVGGFSVLAGLNVVAAVMTGIAGLAAVLFAQAMPRKTKKGAEAYELILGFKWFLSVTEKERLKFHNAPEKSPKQFEEFLPYAMALQVEEQWADQFKDLYRTPPEWYEGTPGATFNAIIFAHAMTSMSSNFTSAATARPSSAGSGGSGFGGGGFSGGGFGGGGGGSW